MSENSSPDKEKSQKSFVDTVKNAFGSGNRKKDLRQKCRDAKNNFTDSSKSYFVKEKTKQ